MSGAASLTTTATTLDIAAGDTLLDWSSFGIGSTESVSVTQPSTSSGVDFRVVGDSLIEIFGHLTSNAPLTLRADYIVVGPQGLIDAPGLSLFAGRLLFVDGLLKGNGVLEVTAPTIVINGPVIDNGIVISSGGISGSGHFSLGAPGGSFSAVTVTMSNIPVPISIDGPGGAPFNGAVFIPGVPEPSAWLMLAMGIATVSRFRRRRENG